MLSEAFVRAFGRRPEGFAEAPGRVNLIGEHVDYNDGLVLPFAIDRSVMVAWSRRDDGSIAARSLDFATTTRFDRAGVPPPGPSGWASYVHGVVRSLADAGHTVAGVDLAISGNVPLGAGLSSSAALEVAIAGAFGDAFALPIDDTDLAKLCQRAENEYVGVQCGIMDQFAATLSERDHALLVDCRTIEYLHVPLRLAEHGMAIVVANSAVRRALSSSAYNERRRECELAVAALRRALGRADLASLRDVPSADVDRAIGASVPSAALRRARHVVTEIARVAAAVEALESGDFEEVGRLMIESHLSLREDYEVSCPELDLLVGLSTAQDYALGARLTGAGFGGCTVNLVRAGTVDLFERDVIAPYRERTGLPAEMYIVSSPRDGLRTWRA